MRALRITFVTCLLIGGFLPASSGCDAAAPGCAAQAPPAADATGIVPGDIVLGNIANFPGHAGIYVGKWAALPDALQQRYAGVFEQAIVRSRDLSLKHSYLVVDSDGGRGVRLTPFVEQFTGFLLKNQREPKLSGALTWEARTGMALAWPDLGVGDPRRWRIVEEALSAAAARVPYDDSHGQWATTGSATADSVSYWSGKVAEARAMPYADMTGLDCIAFVHVAYWRGAGIDLDVSVAPWHTPEQLYAHARDNYLARAVMLEPVWEEAAIAGVWDLTFRTEPATRNFKLNGEIPLQVTTHSLLPSVVMLDPGTLAPSGELQPLELPFARTSLDTLVLEEHKVGSYTVLQIAEFGSLDGYAEGVDDEGPFKILISGSKRLGVEPPIASRPPR